MKPGNWIIRTVMWVLMLTIAAYFGVYVVRGVFDNFTTAPLYTFAAEELVETNGYVVRQEELVTGGSELAAVIVSEGEKVAAGDTLALVYKDEAALQRHQEIKAKENRLNSLRYIFSHSLVGADNTPLNDSIVDTLVELRKTTSDGDLEQVPELTSQLRMMMFRRDYTYNGSTALTEEIEELDETIKQLAEQNRSRTTTITTEKSGTFSGMVDGFENVLTPDAVKVLTPERLNELVSSRSSYYEQIDSGEYLGKLVTGNSWYFVTVMTEEEGKQLHLGGTFPVRLGSMDRTIHMKVESISTPDSEKKVCVLLSSDRFMAEATLLRDQTADIVLSTINGFHVEKSAIHVDNISGEIGVYRVFGTRIRWVPVEILEEGEDYYLIRQAVQYDDNNEPIPVTALGEASRLRVGAEIVTKGRNLYDGKVIE